MSPGLAGGDHLLSLGQSSLGPGLLLAAGAQERLWLLIGENSTHGLSGLDDLFVLRC